MGERRHKFTTTPPPRLGTMKPSVGGEIVEVKGGHIVRSIGRKDRHSKVCTAKGPRDRRVRLSANTAIQFYDVQDRLGYDRPSKAVDWLIKKAKPAIDELAQLPPWMPSTTTTVVVKQQHDAGINEDVVPNHFDNNNNNSSGTAFVPPFIEIADTVKSFFPTGAAETPSSTLQFQTYNSSSPDLPSRTTTSCTQNQDLRLSLQPIQDPMLVLNQQHHEQNQHHNHHVLFSGFDGGGGGSDGWPLDHHQQQQQGHVAGTEISMFQRMINWNSSSTSITACHGGDSGGSHGGREGGGFVFNSLQNSTVSQLPPPSPPLFQTVFGENQVFSQRGALQSSNTPAVRAWIDPNSVSMNTYLNQQQQQQHQHQIPLQPNFHQSSGSFSGYGFAYGGFSGFHVPARIQGEEEHVDGMSNKPSSASSDSRH